MKKDKNDEALLRFSVIAPLVNGTSEEGSISEYVRNASMKTYYRNGQPVRFSDATIKKWYYSYLKSGYDGLITIQRADYNSPRVLNEDVKKEIEIRLKKYPRIKATVIYSALISEGVMEKKDASLKTIQRYVKTLRKELPEDEKERRRFEMNEVNAMWQTDTSTGPYILMDGIKYRTYLIMFLDDCSRLITGFGFYLQDNSINMQKTLKHAIKVYGVPKMLYMDNGGPYVNQQLKIICARLGVICKNTRAYDPQAKGKIERCFRTIKMQWMNGTDWNQFKSLDDVEKSFSSYVKLYNNTVHSTTGETPNNRFHAYDDSRRISGKEIDTMFWHEVKRTADATGVISIEKRKYEVPRECIGKECTYTYDPENLKSVYYDGLECRQLDEKANARKKRKAGISYIGAVNREEDVIDLNKGDENENDEIS